ncbi:enoyl-CoA hydratase-related protein, partial [Bacillus sp. SS-TM]
MPFEIASFANRTAIGPLLAIFSAISAQEAKEYGLVEFVVPANLLEEKAIEIAEKIASNGPIVVVGYDEKNNWFILRNSWGEKF